MTSRRSTRLWRRVTAVLVVVATIVAVGAVVHTASGALSSGWTIVTSPDPDTSVNDLLLGSTCADAQECWAVGAVISNGHGAVEGAAGLFEEWDGSSWQVIPGAPPPAGLDDAVLAVTCVSGSNCWAVGTALGGSQNNPMATLVEHWNGSSWATVASPTPGGVAGALLTAVSCPSASTCVAVGLTTDASGEALNAITERWNGSTWSLAPVASTGQTYDQFNGVSCTSTSNCWAVGSAGDTQQDPRFLPVYPAAPGLQGLIEHWNGSTWSVVPSSRAPDPEGSYLTSTTCVSSTDCWATGTTSDSSGNADTTLTERWDGSTWSATPSANPSGQTANSLSGVTCLDASTCWAAGASGTSNTAGGSASFQPQAFIEAWDGQSWSIEPTPNVTFESLLGSVACVRSVSCWAVGGAITASGQNGVLQTLLERMTFPAASSQGLVMSGADGGIFTLGQATFHGSMGGANLNQRVVGMAAAPDEGGYWEVAADGGIFSFGDAAFHGSMGGAHLNQPIVGMAATPDGGGYWEVAADGGIFSFGDAAFHGSMGGVALNQPVVGMVATPDGGGYWEVAADGGVFSFGDATFYGSTGSLTLSKPIAGIATTPNGRGYWMVAADGGVFAFGNAGFEGSVPGQGLTSAAPVVGMAVTPSGKGYWLAASDGAVYGYGDAAYIGSLRGIGLAAPVVGLATP